jgi:eukaryotic-like serine/threonine-protein kinase
MPCETCDARWVHACPDEAELAAFLDRTLRPGERAAIETHVDGCRSCRETIALVASSDQPRKLGRYRLERVLGRGGMGVVWHAWDPALERAVAIKLLHPDIVEHAGARLMREARTLAKLQHPNVIAVHDVGDVEGELFIATELVDGETLDKWQHGRSPAAILEAYAQAARGLAAVHALGLVHRDVKPSNILVSRDGRVRVGDFGLAIASEVDETSGGVRRSDPKLTSDGAIVGTPAYMAPEQRLGSSVDARADQYSLCLALVEALLGERPSDPSNFTSGDVPAPWDAIARGLAVRPEDRHPDLAPLIAALAAQRRRPRWWIAAAAAAVAVAAGVTIFVLARREDPAAACADLPKVTWDRAAIGAAFAATHLPYAADAANATFTALDQWTKELGDEERSSCEDSAMNRQSADRARKRRVCLDRARGELRALVAQLTAPDAKTIQRAPGNARVLASPAACNTEAGLADQVVAPNPVEEALDERVQSAAALRRIGRLAEARTAAEAVLADARTGGYLREIAAALLELGTIQHTQNDPAAEQTLDEALAAAARAHSDYQAAGIAALLVEVVGQRGDVAAAERQARLARPAIERAGKDPRLEAVIERGLGLANHVASKYAAALDHYQKAEAIHSAIGASDDVDFDQRKQVLALDGLDRLDDATRINDRVLASDRAHLGPRHPRTISDVTLGAILLYRRGRYRDMVAALEENVRFDVQVAGEDSKDVAEMRARLAAGYMALGRLADAEATLRSALRVIAPPGMDTMEARGQRMNLAGVQILLGRYADAEAELAALIPAARAAKDRASLGLFLQNYAEVLTRDGKHREALAAAEEAVAVDAAVFGPRSRQGAEAQVALGNVYVGLGKPDAALTAYRTAIAWFEKLVGPDDTQLGEPLTRTAEVELARGHAAAARPLLERAARLLEHGDPVDLARCRFALARALPDHAAAVVEARAALELYAQAGERAAGPHAEVARWIASHP